MQWDERIGRRIKLRDLHILLAVAQTGGMAKAGTRLAVSQPAISRAIAEMEHVLGVPLLDRGPHGVEPTRYGRALIKRSVAAFDELRQGVKDIEFLSDPTVGDIRIGSTEPLLLSLVTAVIDRLSRQYPRISFDVVHGDPASLLRQLDDRNVELVIARMPGSSVEEHMSVEILYHDPVVIVAGAQNPWLRRRKVALADLVNEPWVLPPHHTVLGSTIREAFLASGLEPPRARVLLRSFALRNNLVATGHFLTAQPAMPMKFSTNQSVVKALPVELPMSRRPIGLVTLKGRALSPVADLFINCTRDVVKSTVGRTQVRK